MKWPLSVCNGKPADEMATVGLQWEARDAYHANIRPMEGCTLYIVYNSEEEPNVDSFEGIETATDKAAYFSSVMEVIRPADEYRNISVAAAGDKEYNDILAVIDAEGNQHLVLIEKANVQIGSFGVWTTVTAKAK